MRSGRLSVSADRRRLGPQRHHSGSKGEPRPQAGCRRYGLHSGCRYGRCCTGRGRGRNSWRSTGGLSPASPARRSCSADRTMATPPLRPSERQVRCSRTNAWSSCSAPLKAFICVRTPLPPDVSSLAQCPQPPAPPSRTEAQITPCSHCPTFRSAMASLRMSSASFREYGSARVMPRCVCHSPVPFVA